ncbi:MAG TPA: OB-fold domain-containing protein [Thermoplasmata archaeon]|nr:OB-fold domain-containing protein [Thermoplasmata archaeon]
MAPPARANVAHPAPESDRAASTKSPLPFLLDFFPLEDEAHTRLAHFFDRLREGRLSTTHCPRDDRWLWPPRIVCPQCHSASLEWRDLPSSGRLYAFSAVLAGAPLGMESEVPFVVGLVDLDGVPLRLFGRIAGIAWDRCRIGLAVRVEPYDLPDGRVFYRFRAGPSDASRS